jgi:predicted dehydrogenase
LIRVGVIGLGYWGPNLVRVFNSSERSSVAGVADMRPEKCAALQTRYPNVTVFPSAEDLIDSEVDAIVVATPLRDHFPLALAALRAGKHVLVEKPFTETAAQAETLVTEAAQRGLVLMVDHTFVYNPAVLLLAKMVRERHLGDLLYFDSRRINLGLFQPDSDVIWDLAVHDFSILDHIVEARPSAVSAVGAAHIDGHRHNTAFITLQYPDQFVAHVDVNWLSPVKVRQLLIGGSQRMVIYDDLSHDNRVRVYDCGAEGVSSNDPEYSKRVDYRFGDMWAPHIPAAEPLAGLASHFIDCIERGEAPRSGGDAGLRIVKILEAATESMRRGGAPIALAMTA